MGKREVIQQAIGDLASLANEVQYKKITPEEICKGLDAIRINLEVFEENDKTLSNTSAHQFKDIVKGMLETYVRKNHDYGNSFEVSMNEEGLAAARIRLGDKWLRFKQLSKGKEALVKDESIRDTLLDMANYAIMTVMWMDNQDKVCKV